MFYYDRDFGKFGDPVTLDEEAYPVKLDEAEYPVKLD